MTVALVVIALVAAWALVVAVFLRANHIAHRQPTPVKPEGEQK